MGEGLLDELAEDVPGLAGAGGAHDEGAAEDVDQVDDAAADLVAESVLGFEVEAVGGGQQAFFLREGFVVLVEDGIFGGPAEEAGEGLDGCI